LIYLNPTKENLIIGFMDGINLEDDEGLFAPKSFSLKRIRQVYFPKTEYENIKSLTDEEIEIQNQQNEEFEKSFCKMFQKAAIFIEKKNY